MAVSSYKVKNKIDRQGNKTGRPGDMYIVKLSYLDVDGSRKHYSKRGFATKKEALKHEGEMKAKFDNPAYSRREELKGNMYLATYMDYWLSDLTKNKKDSTREGYETYIRSRIKPDIGNVKLNQITPRFLDNYFERLLNEEHLANNSVRNIKNILSAALKVSVAYGYLDNNPVRYTITEIKDNSKKATIYTAPQLGTLLSEIRHKNEADYYEFFTVLTGLYGLRRREALGLQWKNIHWDKKEFYVTQALATHKAIKQGKIFESADKALKTQNSVRVLPITPITLHYFQRQYQRYLFNLDKNNFTDLGLAISRKNGQPMNADSLSSQYPQLTKRLDLPRLTVQGLRRSAASNMHALPYADGYTLSRVLGHTIKSISNEFALTNLSEVTQRYIDVSMEKKTTILKAYHECVFEKEKMLDFNSEKISK